MPYELIIVVSLVVVVVVGVTVLCSIETNGSRRGRRRVDKDNEDITTSPVPLPTIPFEIDAVVTWVDSTNPKWRVQKEMYQGTENSNRFKDGEKAVRFEHVDELYYCLKGIHAYLPWIRTVFLVTMRPQAPSYLAEFPKVKVVHHDQMFRVGNSLPSFNSNAIETSLHCVPGLMENFVYFNDDSLIGKPLDKNFFFHFDGNPRMFRRKHINKYQRSNHAMLSKNKIAFTPVAPAHQAIPVRKSDFEKVWRLFPRSLAQTQRSRFREVDDIWMVGLIFQLCDMGWFGRTSCLHEHPKPEDQMLIFLSTSARAAITKQIQSYCEGHSNPSLICINDVVRDDPFHAEIWEQFTTRYENLLTEN